MQDVRRILNKATESATKGRKSCRAAKRHLEHTKKILEQVNKKMESVVTRLEKETNHSVQTSINLVRLQKTELGRPQLMLVAAQGTDRTAQCRH